MRSLHWLNPDSPPDAFPPVERALNDPSGLLAAGGDLRPQRLLSAYRRGIFPWYSEGQPILWWSPDPRCVLFPEEFQCSRTLAKRLRNAAFEVRINTAFDAVMRACGDPALRPEGTWIIEEMLDAYQQLHTLGHAHSLEIWRDDALVGGLYGVQLGPVFFGESMFSRVTDASKVALLHLCRQALPQPIRLIDCQMATPHLRSLGARTLPRAEFVGLLNALLPTTTEYA